MLTDITLGQYFPGNSFIHKLDPRTKLLATLIYIIAIFFAVTPLAYGILTAFAAVVILISRVPWMLVFKSLKPIWIIVILTMLIHMFTAPGEHIVFTWKFLSVTAEGIDMGVKMAVRLILLLLFSSVLTFTTSPIVLTDGIENLLRPFKKLGVPAHELAMMMTIALRFVPTLLEETDKIMSAQPASNGTMMEHPEVSIQIAVAATVILLFSGLLAGLIPAWRAMQIKAIDAIREE